MSDFLSSWYGIALILIFDLAALILAISILYRPIFKRVFDIIGSIVCLVCALPAFIVLIVKHNTYQSKTGEESSFLTTKNMVGKKEKTITLHYINCVNEQGEKTEFGNFVIKNKLEKLPLLLDILFGKISFIGVKAFDEKETRYVEGEDKDRFLVKPGIINPLIISGDEQTDYQEMMFSDKKYAWNFSFWKDLKILVSCILNFTRGKSNEYLGQTREQGYLEYLLQTQQISQIEYDAIQEMDA